MGEELAQVFADLLDKDDVTILCDPVYFGGTVDRSVGSERIVDLINKAGGKAEHVPSREDCSKRIVELARAGDRIVVMGARDDTLTAFARDLLAVITSYSIHYTKLYDVASPSVVRLHRSAGLRVMFKSDRERDQFASAFANAQKRETDSKLHIVTAIFDSREHAEQAVFALKKAGIPEKSIT